MVKIAVLSMALAASMVSAAAAPLKCTPNTLYCGFTLENGKFSKFALQSPPMVSD